jgi:hypothetical protein
MDKHKLKINTDLIDDMGEIDEVNINGTDFVPKPESTNGEIFFTCCDAEIRWHESAASRSRTRQ